MNKFFIILFVVLVIFACSGGNDSNQSGGSLLRPVVDASIDLRLGQVSSASSPVAISAALENRESIVVFLNDDISNTDVVYVNPSQETILVTFDQTGRPKSARTDSLMISFDNYTKENTVDITIQTLLEKTSKTNNIFLPNLQIDPKVVLFLQGDTMIKILLGIDQDIDSSTRALLAAALGALRLVSCDANDIASELAGLFSESFFSSLCSSNLLDLVEEILENSDYRNINVNLTNRRPECDSPTTYEEKKACSLVIWEDLVEAARQGIVGDYPTSKDGDTTGGNSTGTSGDSTTGGNSTGTSGGSTTSGNSTGTSGNITTSGNSTGGTTGGGGGARTGFPGDWTGMMPGTCGSTPTNFEIKFLIAGNPTCSPNCTFTGTFKIVASSFTEMMSGTVDSFGNMTSNNNSSVQIGGMLNGLSATGISDFTSRNMNSCGVLGVPVQLSEGLLGHWVGGGGGTGCGTFDMDYRVTSQGDHSCASPVCIINKGSLIGHGNFPVMTSNITGTVNKDGVKTISSGTQALPSNSTFSGTGTIMNNMFSGAGNATPGCSLGVQINASKTL